MSQIGRQEGKKAIRTYGWEVSFVIGSTGAGDGACASGRPMGAVRSSVSEMEGRGARSVDKEGR